VGELRLLDGGCPTAEEVESVRGFVEPGSACKSLSYEIRRASCPRDLTLSVWNTLRRCKSTVLRLMIQDIGVSSPHHIFVNEDFEVLGAD
jgi:hypothetical protein